MMLLALDMAMCVTLTIAGLALFGIGIWIGRFIEYAYPTIKRVKKG